MIPRRFGTFDIRQLYLMILVVAAVVISREAFPQPPDQLVSLVPSHASNILAAPNKTEDFKIKALDDSKSSLVLISANGDGGVDFVEREEVLEFADERNASGDDASSESEPARGQAEEAADIFDRVEHHQADSGGVSIHYVSLGKGPVILFVHGFPDFWYTWREQMAALSGEFKTVAMDTRANNLSGKPEGVENYAMPFLMADVEAVIKDLGVDSVTLVGHDWGGAIAWQFAMHSPKRVNKLVICNLTHPTGYMTVRRNATPEQKANTNYITQFQTPGFEKRLTPGVLAGISLGKVKGKVRERYVEAFSRSSAKGMLDYYRAGFLDANPAESKDLPKLTMPVLQFHGLKDKAVDKDGLRDTWNWIDADYTLVTLPSSDHWIQRDAADMVSDTMRWWLKSRP